MKEKVITAPERAVKAAGSQVELARRLGIPRQNIYKWIQRGAIPRSMVSAVSEATGIPRQVLMPDVFPSDY